MSEFKSTFSLLQEAAELVRKERPFHQVFHLNTRQKLAYAGVRWLFSVKNRGEGRSVLLARVLLDIAVDNPGLPIAIFGHDSLNWGGRDSESQRWYMMDLIRNMAAQDGIDVKFDGDRTFICEKGDSDDS